MAVVMPGPVLVLYCAGWGCQPGRGEAEDPVLRHAGELEVAGLAAGAGRSAIARRLSVAPRTVEAQAENIRRELQVHSRAQIAAWVTGHRLRSGAAR